MTGALLYVIGVLVWAFRIGWEADRHTPATYAVGVLACLFWPIPLVISIASLLKRLVDAWRFA